MTEPLTNNVYPRLLSPREREWIEWILPADRPGYKRYRELLDSMEVIGEGRRGQGEIILGEKGARVDLESPLPAVFAYGAIETNFGILSITVREILDAQISIEIVSHRADFIPEEFEESRRWTYSTWSIGEPCPQCMKPVREVFMHTSTGDRLMLAICPIDKRMWVYDAASMVNRLIPATNYYNELMLHRNIRDPKIALDSKRLFADLAKYTDEELTYAFLTYNKIRTKVHIDGLVESDRKEKPSMIRRLAGLFRK
ncbi:MAG: hypothetical protein HY033_09145 [Ignavibacteriae bacterium]|nr:hypothetical protein [Ignavibacteria bacterium]MBI3365057.1 hypothetical protein [Ignavibacteriota bacterium]